MDTILYSIPPILLWDINTEEWVVQNEFRVSWFKQEKQITSFYVAAGFRTDLASIPQLFRSVIPQVGRHIQIAITHDWCYSGFTKLSRLQADQMFLIGMKLAGVSWLRYQTMYTAVRMFGGNLWTVR